MLVRGEDVDLQDTSDCTWCLQVLEHELIRYSGGNLVVELIFFIARLPGGFVGSARERAAKPRNRPRVENEGRKTTKFLRKIPSSPLPSRLCHSHGRVRSPTKACCVSGRYVQGILTLLIWVMLLSGFTNNRQSLSPL